METGLETGCVKFKQDYSDLDEISSISEKPSRDIDQFEDVNRNADYIFGSEGSLECHVKEEEDDGDLDENGQVTDRLLSKRDQFEDTCRSTSDMFESETVLEFFIKEEENIKDCDENCPFTKSSSTENDRCGEQVLERGRDVLHKSCNIKQEEVEDDFNGIIEGFLDECDDQGLMQDVEDHYSQVSRFQPVADTFPPLRGPLWNWSIFPFNAFTATTIGDLFTSIYLIFISIAMYCI